MAVLAGLGACTGDSPQKHVAAAKASLQAQDPRTAIIELKNALQQSPDLGEARFLLGQALLDSSSPTAAVVELRKSRELKYDDSQVAPLLARAMNQTGESRKVIEQFGKLVLPQPAAMAELKTSLAVAQAATGNAEASERELAAALKAYPDSPVARLFEARTQVGKGDADAAMRTVDALLQKSPADADAWVFKADLLRAKRRDPEGALAAYRKALEARKSFSAAHSGVIAILLEKKQFDAATTQLAQFRKFWPGTTPVKWFEAQLAFERRDLKEAGKLAEQLLSAAPNDVRFLYFSATIGLLNGAVLQAENSLGKALRIAPENVAIRRLLARAELSLGQPAKALVVLQPLIDGGRLDADALAIAAQAELLGGNADKAQQYFAQAAKLNPNDKVSRTALAVSKIAKGEANDGLSELRELAVADTGTAADLQLIAALVREKDFDAAMNAVGALEKKQPANPLAHHLRGLVLMQKKDEPGARASFERATAIDPKYYLSAAALAVIDLHDKKPDAARKRFEAVLAADPKNMPATLALIELRARAGAKPEELREMIANAVKLDPTAAAPRMLLIDQWLRAKDLKQALAVAQSGTAALPEDARLLDALARIQLATGDQSQAIASFGRLAILQPQSAAPHLQLAEIHMAAKRKDAARQSLKRALLVDPASVPARRGLIQIELADGDRPAALELAQGLQKLRPGQAPGLLLEGDVQMAGANWPAAIAAYGKAAAVDKSSEPAIKLHSALIAGGRQAQADAHAATRLKESPTDQAFIFHLGEVALTRKQFELAESRFAEVVRINPNSAVALNNLAWLMVQLQKKGALAHAEKANSLQPEEPPFIDTLADALAFEGQLDKAVQIQKKLVESRPAINAFRLHLAKLYVQAGNKAQAKTELERLSALGSKLAEKDEVARLLKTL